MWWMSFSYQGKQVRRSTGTSDRKLAEAILAKVRVNIVEGRYFEMLQERERTFREMMDRYMKECAPKKASKSNLRDQTCLKHLLPYFGEKALAEVTPKLIAAYKVKRREEGSAPATLNNEQRDARKRRQKAAAPATLNKELGLMKAAFNVAIREWEWCRDNPVRRVSMERVNNARVRWVNDDEFASVLERCPDWLKPIVQVARYTGMRRENIIGLQWDQVDFFRKVILLDQTKNGDRLGIPLCERVVEVFKVLARVRHIRSKYVFTGPEGQPYEGAAASMAFIRACRAAGIENFRFHDLRHTFASLLVQRGVDLYRVQRLLGHRDGRMTQRYSHLSPENLREAVWVFDQDCDRFSTNLAQSRILKKGGNNTSH